MILRISFLRILYTSHTQTLVIRQNSGVFGSSQIFDLQLNTVDIPDP